MPLFADLRHGDCREIIATLDDNSIDAIVTDPPYELGIKNNKWDNTGIAHNVQLWTECLRVLKPGGHLLAFGGTRTYHRMASAIEDAGFEIRDSIQWLYSSGFPKSHDVSKLIDKRGGYPHLAAEVEREVVGKRAGAEFSFAPGKSNQAKRVVIDITAPATDAARQWEGWGTALKPAHELIVMARKPLIGTVAANVLQHGTGALNIDATRIDMVDEYAYNGKGRWPANVILDGSINAEWVRFFYCAKASKAERNAGLGRLPSQEWIGNYGAGIQDNRPHTREGYTHETTTRNIHPTVKPLALMRYLVRLVTPPGGTVLEPFAGSGTTLVAAILEGFDVIGCELTVDYLPIIEGRIAWAQQQYIEAHDNLFGENQ